MVVDNAEISTTAIREMSTVPKLGKLSWIHSIPGLELPQKMKRRPAEVVPFVFVDGGFVSGREVGHDAALTQSTRT